MFDDLKPDDVPAPPPQALEAAVRRGTGIRRRRRVAWASGAAAVALLVVVVVLGNPFGTTNAAVVVPATVTATPAAPKDYSPIPENPTEEKDGVSFGYLQQAGQDSAGRLTLLIQPAYFLIGKAAAAKNGGELPIDDYLTDVTPGTKPTTFRLDPKATLLGVQSLLGHIDKSPTDGTRITGRQLLTNVRKTTDPSIFVWFRLADDGSITSMREQFTP